MKLRIIIEQDEDKIFVAQCLTLPGCISQGKTREEALKNIKDVAEGYIASLKKHNETILSENFELSHYAKKTLKQAREAPENEYMDL